MRAADHAGRTPQRIAELRRIRHICYAWGNAAPLRHIAHDRNDRHARRQQ
jgi:hypothetical protein